MLKYFKYIGQIKYIIKISFTSFFLLLYHLYQEI